MQPEDSNNAHEWHHKAYSYGPSEAYDPRVRADSECRKLSELRSAVSEQTAQGAIVLRLSSNLFEASTGAHEWGAGFRLAELLLSCPLLVRGASPDLLHQTCTQTHIQAVLTPGRGTATREGCCAGKFVLELGCGAGLLGVALAHLGARALLTDGSGPTLANCLHNLGQNGVAAELIAAPSQAATIVPDTEVCPGCAVHHKPAHCILP